MGCVEERDGEGEGESEGGEGDSESEGEADGRDFPLSFRKVFASCVKYSTASSTGRFFVSDSCLIFISFSLMLRRFSAVRLCPLLMSSCWASNNCC